MGRDPVWFLESASLGAFFCILLGFLFQMLCWESEYGMVGMLSDVVAQTRRHDIIHVATCMWRPIPVAWDRIGLGDRGRDRGGVCIGLN